MEHKQVRYLGLVLGCSMQGTAIMPAISPNALAAMHSVKQEDLLT